MCEKNNTNQNNEIRDHPSVYIREYLRRKVNIPVEIKILLDGKEFNKGTAIIKDISPTGALLSNIQLEKEILPARPFNILIKVTDDKFSGIEGKCTPVRFAQDKEFALGVKFDELFIVK